MGKCPSKIAQKVVPCIISHNMYLFHTCTSFFCWAQNIIFWRMWHVTPHWLPQYEKKYYGSPSGPKTWFKIERRQNFWSNRRFNCHQYSYKCPTMSCTPRKNIETSVYMTEYLNVLGLYKYIYMTCLNHRHLRGFCLFFRCLAVFCNADER